MSRIKIESYWTKIRLLGLILTFIGITGSGIYYFFFLNSSLFQEKRISLPNSLPLKGWKFQSKDPLKISSRKANKNVQGYRYRYLKEQQQLTIELINEKYSGNINQFLMIYKDVPPATVLIQEQYDARIGRYGFFSYQDKIHLTTCLNPQGYTTVTEEQFTKNRYRYGGGIQRTLRWIIGQDDLFNSYCLWTLMYLDNSSIDSDSSQLANQLKSVWLDLYESQQLNF